MPGLFPSRPNSITAHAKSDILRRVKVSVDLSGITRTYVVPHQSRLLRLPRETCVNVFLLCVFPRQAHVCVENEITAYVRLHAYTNDKNHFF